MLSLVFLLKGSLPRAAHAALVLCWPQTFKELRSRSHPLFVPSSVPKAGAKVLPFSHSASTFFKYFSIILYLTVYQLEKFSNKARTSINLHLINIIMRKNQGKKASSMWLTTGSPSLKMMEMMSKRVLTSNPF